MSMSDSQKSPSYTTQGLSEDMPIAAGSDYQSQFSSLPLSANMEINTATSNADSAFKQPPKMTNNLFGAHGYMLPSMMMPPNLRPPLNSNLADHMAMLVQMQMLTMQPYYQQEMANENGKLWADVERQKEMLEKEKLEVHKLTQLKQKPKEQQSANASSEVKQHLRSAILQRKNTNKSTSDIKESYNRSWKRSGGASPPNIGVSSSAVPQSVGNALSSSMSPPFTCTTARRVPEVGGTYKPEFPIRKTASEPNLKVKTALKNKLALERNKNSPLFTRKRPEKHCTSQLLNDGPLSNGHYLSTSPPSSLGIRSSHGSTPAIAKEVKASKRTFEETLPPRYLTDNLYISMPNISAGQSNPATHPLHNTDLRKHKLPAPLTNQYHPSIVEEDYLQSHLASLNAAMNEARRLAHPYLQHKPNTATVVPDQRHLHPKQLSRTQSAPLPMVHPHASLLMHATPIIEQQELNQLIKEQQKKLIRCNLRHQLLQKTASKSHMEHVDEESEQILLKEMQESREDEHNKPLHSSHSSIYSSAARPNDLSLNNGSTGAQGLDLSASRRKTGPRFLSRTHSSPLVGFMPQPTHPEIPDNPINLATKPVSSTPDATGVVYDEAMLRHHCPCQNNDIHLENPTRIQSIFNRLNSSGLLERTKRIDAKKATIQQLQLCHTESYSLYFGLNTVSRKKHEPELNAAGIELQKLPCGGITVDSDTVWNEDHSPHAARIAAGSVIELASRVYEGHLKNGLAIVRPPGHHSEQGTAMGFCFFNSIAIAAKHLKHMLGASKILILDWDVHHGNGTQQMTYDDPGILYISLHRHDNGNFFPGTGSATDCGEKSGLGFNVNIPFYGLNPPMGDAEYMAAFRSLVMPIVEEFKPQITLVSAGFDAAEGHAAPLGGYNVSSSGFAYMTQQLMSICDGKVVLVLEGGYNLTSISDASEMCMKALLNDKLPLPSQEEILRPPCSSAVITLQQCSAIQAQFWPCVSAHKSKMTCSFVDSLRLQRERTTPSLANSKTSSTDSEPMDQV